MLGKTCLQVQILVPDICGVCEGRAERQREPRQPLRLERLKLHPVVFMLL